MEIALVVLMVIGAFLLGIVIAWLAKGYVEDYIENAAYSKSVVHPEMFDEHGNLAQVIQHKIQLPNLPNSL